jgi:hypothetical protein
MTKSKAIKSFLKALSHQVPNESLDPLLKPQNDALFVLLNSSIEALPMGSAIRKEVDSNMEDCIDVFRKELEMRKQEMEKKTNAHDEDVENVPFSTDEKIPLINSKLFHLAYNQSNGKDMERFLCSDYATGEIILNHILSKGKKKTASVRDVNVAIQHAFSAGQLSSLDEYIQLFVENLESSNGSRSDVVAEIKSFLKLILLSKDALGVPMDTIKAIDLGKIVGELVTIAVTNTEEYNIALIKANRYDDDDDDSSDDETLKVLPKKHLPKTEYITMKEECVRDALLVLSMIYSFTNSMDAFKIASAYLTTGLIGVLQDINGKDDHALKDATEILIKALDRSNVMDKHELPSAKLIQDATKRIQLLSKWAERVLKTASLQSQAASEEDAPNSNPIFVMDTFANDVSVESDSDNDADDGSNESESAHASDTDSNEDKESMFILDTEKSDIGIEVTKNDDDENEEDDDSDNEDNDDNDDEEEEEDNENDNDENDDNNDRNEAESDRNEIKETKSKKPSLKKQSKAVLEAVPEDEEVDPTPSKTTTGKTIHATPKRRTRSNSNMSNLSADTPTRMTRSRARGMSTSSIDTFGQESIASSSSKTTPRSTRKRSVSGASDTPVATRRSSRRLK